MLIGSSVHGLSSVHGWVGGRLTNVLRKGTFATFSVQYNNNGFYIAHDLCHLFTGPTLKKQRNIILDLTMRKNGTIGVDSSAYTALRCHVSVMLLCLFAF